MVAPTMDKIRNTFSPGAGAGAPPPELAGCEGILEQAQENWDA